MNNSKDNTYIHGGTPIEKDPSLSPSTGERISLVAFVCLFLLLFGIKIFNPGN